MPPLAIAAGIGAIGAIGGGLLSASAQKKAANTAAASADRTAAMNNALSRDIYNQNRTTLAPFVQSGANATGRLDNLLARGPTGLTPLSSQYMATMDPGSFDQWKTNTGYDYNLEQGMKGIGIGAGARGWLQSGAAIKSALGFQDDLATRAYGDWRNATGQYGQYGDQFANQERAYTNDRNDNYLGLLANQQGVGLSAASAQAGVGQNYVNNVTANNNSAGTVAANAALARGAANSSMYAGIGNALGNLAGSFGSSYGGQGGNQWGMYPSGGVINM